MDFSFVFLVALPFTIRRVVSTLKLRYSLQSEPFLCPRGVVARLFVLLPENLSFGGHVRPFSAAIAKFNMSYALRFWIPPSSAGKSCIKLPSRADSMRAVSARELSLVVQTDAFYLWTCELVVQGRTYQPWRGDDSITRHRRYSVRGKIAGSFSDLIGIFSMHGTNWHHFMIDTLAFLLWIPAAIRSRSVFPFYDAPWRRGTFIPPMLDILGIESRVIILNAWDYVWADRVYFFHPFQSGQDIIYGRVVESFRSFVVLKFGLDRHIPEKCWLGNRPRGKSR
jgi:hypothetical protein